MQLEFFGAAGEVTGSCHILRAGGRALLLDCGMIQGGADAPVRNRRAFPFEASAIDAVVLSHAHVDHCGRLPLLVKRGYRGPVYTNRACADLLPILLRDSAQLLMRDAERAIRDGTSGDERAAPLFNLEDVEAVLRQVEVIAYDSPHEVLPGVTVRVREAGHILGSSSVELWVVEGNFRGAPGGATDQQEVRRKLVFSGDLGQYDTPILQDPYRFVSADLVLMESTYGDRLHRGREDTARELGTILAQAARDGGNVIVPAFAIGRSQELLYLLAQNYAEWHVARWKIFLDSPMAIAASRVYWQHPDRFDEESARLRASFRGMPPLPNLVLSETPEDSRAINNIRGGAIVIAGSGMANGGRVLHHLKHNRRVTSATWSSPASRRLARWDASWSTASRKFAFMGARCAWRRRFIPSVGCQRMRTSHNSYAGMTASRVGLPCTWYMAKCPRPKHWPSSCVNLARRPRSHIPV
jgi:metallo-beta-lactamase family protein